MTTESINITTPFTDMIFTEEGCTLKDGSPYCLHGGDCYKVPFEKKPTCICISRWLGRRCNILSYEYDPALDKCEGDFL